MRPLPAAAIGLAALLITLFLVWMRQRRTHNATPVDAAWSIGTGSLGVWFACVGSAPGIVRPVLAVMAGSWGLRLGLHLFWRMHGKPEDSRYAALRRQWGTSANLRMLLFFAIQGVIALLLSAGIVLSAWRAEPVPAWALALALFIWAVALAGEALADGQLERFRREPANRGHVCRRGLWRYSRHPNYFFETMYWFAYAALAAGTGWWFIALLPPALMALLLLKLSGVPLVEGQAAATRPEYAEYIRTTSALVPWPPKRGREPGRAA